MDITCPPCEAGEKKQKIWRKPSAVVQQSGKWRCWSAMAAALPAPLRPPFEIPAWRRSLRALGRGDADTIVGFGLSWDEREVWCLSQLFVPGPKRRRRALGMRFFAKNLGCKPSVTGAANRCADHFAPTRVAGPI